MTQYSLASSDPQLSLPSDLAPGPISYPGRLTQSDPDTLNRLHPDEFAAFQAEHPKAPSDTLGITLDPPALWPVYPPDPTYNNYFTSPAYRNPLAANSDLIVFNAWSKEIEGPRYLRACFREVFIQLSHYMVTSDVCTFIDSLTPSINLSGTRHYFYRHCFSFRYIHPNVPFWEQGFQTACVHHTGSTLPSLPHVSRTAYFPRSPLLTWEEDEFLYHCTLVFHMRGELALFNAIQDLQHENSLPFSAELYWLFINGYLDPAIQYDREGICYPIVWTAPRLHAAE